MSKEYLEAFENIMKVYGNTNSLEGTYNDFLTIKKALQHLEAIENAESTEVLEELFKTTYFGSKEEYDKINNCYNSIKQALLKTQEQEVENTRAFGKDIINLNKTLKQSIDKPILYVSRDGNKYIVPQELFEEQCNILVVIKEKNVDIQLLKGSNDRYEYNMHFPYREIYHLTEKEFELLKMYLNKEVKIDENN